MAVALVQDQQMARFTVGTRRPVPRLSCWMESTQDPCSRCSSIPSSWCLHPAALTWSAVVFSPLFSFFTIICSVFLPSALWYVIALQNLCKGCCVPSLVGQLPPPQPFYGPFSGTTQVSQYQKRTSGLYGAREDQQRQTHRPSGWVPLHPD